MLQSSQKWQSNGDAKTQVIVIEDGSCSDGTLRPERGTFAWNIQESIQKEVFLMLEPKKKQEFARGSENRKYSRQEKKKSHMRRSRREYMVCLKNWKKFSMTQNEQYKVGSAKNWGRCGKRASLWGLCKHEGFWLETCGDQKNLSSDTEDELQGGKTRVIQMQVNDFMK